MELLISKVHVLQRNYIQDQIKKSHDLPPELQKVTDNI